ncbi:hypothetical protein Q8F55_003331 [Vanrija albida]|uniref:Uncharacterized protein n=1 Tax=Vanrija albida TaxID=181172 RepID=A0ABR3Q3M4_9TREE
MFAARLPLLALSSFDSAASPPSSPARPRRLRSTMERLSSASLTAVLFTVLAKIGSFIFSDEPILAEFFRAVFLLGLAAQIVAAWLGIGYALYRRQTPMRRWIVQLIVLLMWDQLAGPTVLLSVRRMNRQLSTHVSGMADAKLPWKRPEDEGPTEADEYWSPHGADTHHLAGQRLYHLKPGTFLFIVSSIALVGFVGYRVAERAWRNKRVDDSDGDSFSDAGSVEEQVEKEARD